MKTYDVNCPCCGHRNADLYLEETEGWMECEKCGELTQVTTRFEKRVKIPVFRMEDLGKVMAAGLI
ncbi:MAG: translation initiation factor 2 [Eubacterium sp.]|nr:translation initiation factor 2 [Eubacterium sp.]